MRNETRPAYTARLLLRPLEAGDAEALDELIFRDPEVCRYTGFTSDRAGAAQLALLPEPRYLWCWLRKGTGELVGFGGVVPGARGLYELGYFTGRRWWGMGYATEATGALLRRLREEQGLRGFTARQAEANPASGRVLEKLGFTRRGRTVLTKLDGSERFDAIEWRDM